MTLRDQLRAAETKAAYWQGVATVLREVHDTTKDEWADRASKAEAFIRTLGYRRCDVAACNCGSWHRER